MAEAVRAAVVVAALMVHRTGFAIIETHLARLRATRWRTVAEQTWTAILVSTARLAICDLTTCPTRLVTRGTVAARAQVVACLRDVLAHVAKIQLQISILSVWGIRRIVLATEIARAVRRGTATLATVVVSGDADALGARVTRRALGR